jgi:hypothetical protein
MRTANLVDKDVFTALALFGASPSLLRSIAREVWRFRMTTAANSATQTAAPAKYTTMEKLLVAVCVLLRLLLLAPPVLLDASAAVSSFAGVAVGLTVGLADGLEVLFE